MADEEILADFTASRDIPATQARSTLVTTSIQSIRAHGRFADYEKALPTNVRDTILTVVAGVWLSIDLAAAHYEACTNIGLTSQEQVAIGREVGDRVQGTMLGLLTRTAKQDEVTPWTGLLQCHKLYERIFQGGSPRLIRIGAKDARLEIVNNRLFSFEHFRNGFRGIVSGGVELFAKKSYVHELPKLTSATSLGLRISWG
jgi:hypothetical protein